MRIRNQIVMAIVPLFLGMTLVTGALTYYLQVKELTWGHNEEATSIAVAAASLADEATVRRLTGGEALADNPVRDQFRRIVGWGRARRLTLLGGGDSGVLIDVVAAGAAGGAVTVAPALARSLEREPFAVGPPRPDASGGASLHAFAPVRDAAGALLGIVAVETNAGTLAGQRAAILRSAFISLCTATLLGLILAAVIAAMITRRLSRLTRAVNRVEAVGEVPETGTGLIEEVNDLVNTFDTMKSVLGEVLAKTDRARIEGEQFRADEDLTRAFQEEFQRPAHRAIAGLEVAGCLLGRRPLGSLFGIWEVPGGGCAFVGTVSEPQLLEQTVAASAALAYLEEVTRTGAIGPALERMAELFPLIQGEALGWRRGGQNAVRWSFDWGAGQWGQERIEPSAGAPLVLHTLGTHAGRRLQTYVAQFHQLPPDELLREIRGVIDEQLAGAVLLARRAAVDAAAPEAGATAGG